MTQTSEVCPSCGQKIRRRRARAEKDADEARELIFKLTREYGSVRKLALAFAARHGKNPMSVQRAFYRLTCPSRETKALYSPLLDELWVME